MAAVNCRKLGGFHDFYRRLLSLNDVALRLRRRQPDEPRRCGGALPLLRAHSHPVSDLIVEGRSATLFEHREEATVKAAERLVAWQGRDGYLVDRYAASR